MRGFIAVIGTVLLPVITLALVIGLSLGIGWVLTLFLPVSLFEGALLGMIAAAITGRLWYSLWRSSVPFPKVAEEVVGEEEGEEWEMEDEIDEVPESQFWRTSEERTWENWFRYTLANAIYEELLESPHWIENLEEEEQQALVIRLADAALEGLKAQAFAVKRMRVSRGMMRQEMTRRGDQTYPDGLLNLAVRAVNMEAEYLEEDLQEVARGRLWDELAEV
ncbi:MAG: hypothetical protein HYW07_13305 [Candidatus Latescibacteria bacterium]|nr:hypothetical protein [Candidatus Latescibacterota bacterium]